MPLGLEIGNGSFEYALVGDDNCVDGCGVAHIVYLRLVEFLIT